MIINGKNHPNPARVPPPVNAPYWYLLGYNGGAQKDFWKGDELDHCRLSQNRVFTTAADANKVHAAFQDLLTQTWHKVS